MYKAFFIVSSLVYLGYLARPSRQPVAIHLDDVPAALKPVSHAATIRYRVRNNGWRDLRLATARVRAPLLVERRIGGTWQVHRRLTMDCLERTALRHATAAFGKAENCSGEVALHVPGTFRFRIMLARPRGKGWHNVMGGSFTIDPAPSPPAVS